ncbi:MAG TPA: ExeM/NucH family extracellular endonuclease, partial [Candidatus Limnocylindrales bacterium]|nr:ExeM/NucH family extracellular endonuclease [Candidatus Limnocylindrales bacterium]
AGVVVISQVYGGGGNSGATLTNDFVELFNRSDAPVSLEGWSVQYASTSGTSWQVTQLSGSIAAGGYYLVGEGAGAGGDVPLPAPDAVGSILMSATNGKVALSPSTTSLEGSCPLGGLADFVGFGTASCFEGTGATPSLNNETAALRDEDGCQDTDDNAADFAVGDPTPRNSASPLKSCSGVPVDAAPSVTSTLPADGSVNVETDQSIGVTFSEAVTLATGWFDITCSTSGTHSATVTGGPASYAIDPDSDFVAGDQCTVTVFAASVTDDDAIDPPDTMAADEVFSFSVGTLSCGSPTHFIHEVQGAGLTSPIEGSTVTVEGIVVGDYQGNDPGLSGFFIQEEAADADANPLTSEGIFVFDGFDPVPVSVGDVVSVTAEVDEFFGQTELTNVIDVTPCGTTADIAPTEVALPVADTDDLEAFEGMLVSFDQTLTVTETFSLGRFGEVVLSADGRQFQGTHVAEPGAPAAAVEDLNARSRIVLDDGDTSQNDDPTRYPTGGLSAENTLRVGSTVDDLTAVLAFDHGLYRLQPVGEITFEDGERPDGPPDVGGRIQVASFNVLNYFNGNGDGTGFDAPEQRGAQNSFEFERQRTKIINAISILDAEVVGLMEIENDGDAEYPAIADLVDGLNAKLGAGTYDYIDAGRVGTDAIAVAIIYQPSAVSPLGEFAVLDSSVDPRFDEDRNRAALAQTFVENETGAAFTVAVNHLKSKGSPCGAGDDQPDSLGGNCNVTRT